MPNNVVNVIRMASICNQPLFRLDNENEIQFDFNKLVPMNDDLLKVEGLSERLHYLAVATVYKVFNVPDELFVRPIPSVIINNEIYEEERERFKRYSDKELIDIGLLALTNKVKYGNTDWYEWRIKNWGTKWNAYETNVNKRYKDWVSFETAWSAPEPIIATLARLYPEAVIQHWWAEEFYGSGNSGYMLYMNGRVYGGYDDPMSLDAFIHCDFCWGGNYHNTECLHGNAIYELGYGNVVYPIYRYDYECMKDPRYRHDYAYMKDPYSNAIYHLVTHEQLSDYNKDDDEE
jgi:hypothetical protein